jgi:hypothetical protein
LIAARETRGAAHLRKVRTGNGAAFYRRGSAPLPGQNPLGKKPRSVLQGRFRFHMMNS